MSTTDASQTYNGWANRATWNINLWLMNEEPNYRACVDYAKRTKETRLGRPSSSNARKFCEEIFGSETPDGCKLTSKVDWKAIAESIAECAD